MKYYIYTLGVCACAFSLFLITNDLFVENLSKGDALGLSLVSIIMLVFFVVELTRIEHDE
jgi:hypothetical protein